MDDGTSAPLPIDWARELLFQHYGYVGVLAAAFCSALFFAYTHWDTVRKWPFASALARRLFRKALPVADPRRPAVAVANLDSDTERGDYKRLILAMLRDFKEIQILSFDRTISVSGSVPEEQERAAHEQAQEYLRQTNVSVLIWGSVLRCGDEAKPNLYVTAARASQGQPQQYSIHNGMRFHLPQLWESVAEVLRLAVSLQSARYASLQGQFVADDLTPFIDRVRSLLGTSAEQPGCNFASRVSTHLILAEALHVVGVQSGNAGSLKDAVQIYRDLLKSSVKDLSSLDRLHARVNLSGALLHLGTSDADTRNLEEAVVIGRELLDDPALTDPLQRAAACVNFAGALGTLGRRLDDERKLEEAISIFRETASDDLREIAPFDWATARFSLGVTLLHMGARCRGTAVLKQAEIALREALEEQSSYRVPLAWAASQAALGAVLSLIGSRTGDESLMWEAIDAFHQAMTVRRRDNLPLDWAETQHSLGNALLLLARMRGQSALMRDAAVAFREALKERTREHVPLAWSNSQDGLGAALSGLGEGGRDIALLKEAISAHREALLVRQRERAPVLWALSQHNLGTALGKLGELEGSAEILKAAVAALREALKERTRGRLPLDWAETRMGLARVLESLGTREKDARALQEAIVAYRDAIEIYKSEGPLDLLVCLRKRLSRLRRASCSRSSSSQNLYFFRTET